MDFETYYEIPRVAEFIRDHGYVRVALQFPDGLLKDSMRVVRALRRVLNPQVKLYVMADTTYGSCCVDEVGAAHVNAQCVVHYGHTCLSPTSTLPALFIFGKDQIVVEKCAKCLIDYGVKSNKPVLVLCGLEYAYAMPELKELLESGLQSSHGPLPAVEISIADLSCSVMWPSGIQANSGRLANNACSERHQEENGEYHSIGGLSWRLPNGRTMEDYLIFWIGLENQAFANAVLTFNSSEIFRYDATEDRLEFDLSSQKRILKRRYYLIEKVKDASMIGILVGTLGAAGYLHTIHLMRELIENAGKKSYTFVMGKPNPSKLANFPECDAFVHVSCAQTALLDSKDFLAPVITPFEAMVALDRGCQWTGAYALDFRDLTSSVSSTTIKEHEEARFSFIKGGYVEDQNPQGRDAVTCESKSDPVLALVDAANRSLQIRNNRDSSPLIPKTAAKSGAEYLARRSYQGLDLNGTSSPSSPGSFLTGRSGKASGYRDEKA